MYIYGRCPLPRSSNRVCRLLLLEYIESNAMRSLIMYYNDTYSIDFHCDSGVAMAGDSAANRSGGVSMYRKKAALCHRPRSWIAESSTPAKAADVAAPIRKLCPAYWSAGNPSVIRIFRSSDTKVAFDIGFPSDPLKKGPGCAFLIMM